MRALPDRRSLPHSEAGSLARLILKRRHQFAKSSSSGSVSASGDVFSGDASTSRGSSPAVIRRILCDMAKTPGTSAAVTKEEKKVLKTAQKAEKKDRRGQLWQAFNIQRKEDSKLLPMMIGALLVVAAIVVGVGLLLRVQWYFALPFGLILGVAIAMILFARRAQSNIYAKADGTPGAAAWSLQNNLRGKWRVTPAIAGTTHMDAVHRVIGRPGVILVGEGAVHRVKPLLAQEKKRIARVVGDTPIYDVIVGNDDGQTPLRKLNPFLMKLPRNISAGAVEELDARLTALRGRSPQAGLPKGPMPAGAKTRSVQRTARRR